MERSALAVATTTKSNYRNVSKKLPTHSHRMHSSAFISAPELQHEPEPYCNLRKVNRKYQEMHQDTK